MSGGGRCVVDEHLLDLLVLSERLQVLYLIELGQFRHLRLQEVMHARLKLREHTLQLELGRGTAIESRHLLLLMLIWWWWFLALRVLLNFLGKELSL